MYVYGCVVDGIQLRIPQCEEDSLEALGEIIATAAVGHLLEKPLVENRGHAGEVFSSVGYVRARCRAPVLDRCGEIK